MTLNTLTYNNNIAKLLNKAVTETRGLCDLTDHMQVYFCELSSADSLIYK